MPRALNCRLVAVGAVRKTVKKGEDADVVRLRKDRDGQLIIASRHKPTPMSKRGYVPWVRGTFKVRHSLAAFLAATVAPPLSPPSPPVPRVRLKLRPPPPPPPPPPPEPPPVRFAFPTLTPRYQAVAKRARTARFDLICDLAGVPGTNRPPMPDVPPWALPLPPPPSLDWTPARKRPKRPKRSGPPEPPKPSPVAPVPREPEPNLLAWGEVDLICWETMPPPTP